MSYLKPKEMLYLKFHLMIKFDNHILEILHVELFVPNYSRGFNANCPCMNTLGSMTSYFETINGP